VFNTFERSFIQAFSKEKSQFFVGKPSKSYPREQFTGMYTVYFKLCAGLVRVQGET
jgi:hypothetical protein